MSTRRDRFAGGLTLIEVMVAVGVIAFAVVGGMGLRYYSSLDARKADVYVSASRVGWMLLEQWRAHEGAADFDPGSGGGGGCATGRRGSGLYLFLLALAGLFFRKGNR